MCFSVIRAQENNHCAGKLTKHPHMYTHTQMHTQMHTHTHTHTHRCTDAHTQSNSSWTNEERPPSTDRPEKVKSTMQNVFCLQHVFCISQINTMIFLYYSVKKITVTKMLSYS